MAVSKNLSVVTLFLLVSFPSTCSILFAPALPSIVSYFHLSQGAADLTFSVFLIGYSLGQLFYGPLANRYGRKNTLYVGLTISAVSSILSGLSSVFDSFSLLIIGRAFQAFGACVGLKMSYTMIADTYDQIRATKLISKLGTSFAVAPAIGMAIGGYLTQQMGWESCFYFLFLVGLYLIWRCTKLPETQKDPDLQALRPRRILEGYGSVLKSPPAVFSGLILGLGTAITYIYNANAPFLGIQKLGLSPDSFGVFNTIPLSGMFFGALLSAQLAGRFSIFGLLTVGTVCSIVFALIMLFFFSSGGGGLFSLFLPMFFIYVIDSVLFANVMSYGLAISENKANGSAMINFISLGTVFFVLSSLQFFSTEIEFLMPLSFIVLLLGIFVLCFGLRPVQEQMQLQELEPDQDQSSVE